MCFLASRKVYYIRVPYFFIFFLEDMSFWLDIMIQMFGRLIPTISLPICSRFQPNLTIWTCPRWPIISKVCVVLFSLPDTLSLPLSNVSTQENVVKMASGVWSSMVTKKIVIIANNNWAFLHDSHHAKCLTCVITLCILLRFRNFQKYSRHYRGETNWACFSNIRKYNILENLKDSEKGKEKEK